MAPSTTMQKVLRDARKQQKAFGPRTWATPFPHNMLKEDKHRVTKITKVHPQPTKFFMDLNAAYKKFEQSTTGLQEKSTTPECQPLHKPVMPECTVAKQPTIKDSQDMPVMPVIKSVPECTIQDKSVTPPCMVQEQDSVAPTKITTKPAVAKRATRRVGKPMAAFKPLLRDSLSPLPTTSAISRMGHKKHTSRNVSPSCLKGSSSSLTSAKGVHLLLAVIPIDHFDLWLDDWKTVCACCDDHVSALYSSIEKILDPVGLQVYADCDNKTVAELLKKKVTDKEVLDKQLICRYI